MLSQNEQYYRKVIASIGATMLFFLLLFSLFSVLVTEFSYLVPIENEVAYYVIYQIVYAAGYLASFMLPVAFFKLLMKKTPYPYRSMRSLPVFPAWALLAIPFGIALIFAAAYINTALVDIFHFSDFMNEILESAGSDGYQPYEVVLEFIVICLVPGFCEEFLFRGAILTNCLPFGRSSAILISALMFALMHQNPTQFFYAFVAGIFLGILYERSGSIWPCVLLHTMNNFTSVVEGIFMEEILDPMKMTLVLTAFELLILLLGVVAMLILVPRFFGKRRDFSNGVFGKSVAASNHYAAYPVAPQRMVKLFWTPCMVIFVLICALEAVMLLGMAWLYGIFA